MTVTKISVSLEEEIDRADAAVLTSDPDDLQRLAATTKIRLQLHQV